MSLYNEVDKKDNKIWVNEILDFERYFFLFLDIVGKVVEEILWKVNIFEEEVNRKFICVERVDKSIDKEEIWRE